MSITTEEIVFLVLQFLNEGALKEAAHTLERETGLYFDLKHFEAMVLEGKWDDAEIYLSGFTKVYDNLHSARIYFEMRKQKYIEALDINDRSKAVDILTKDLKVFAENNEELFKEITQLLTLNNIRECEKLSTYQDANSARKIEMDEIKNLIEHNPLLESKLKFPSIQSQSLRHLLNKRLNRMHQNHAPAPSCYSGPSTSAPTNPDTALSIGYPNEIFEGRRSNVSEEVFEIRQPFKCSISPLMRPEANKIVRLTYTNAGNDIIALALNGTHQVWSCRHSSSNLEAKATTQVFHQLWQPTNGFRFMTNDLKGAYLGDTISSFAISKTDSHLISTSGGMISLFNILTFETLKKIMPPPLMVTCLAFHPQDDNILVVGLDDSSILIYNISNCEVQTKLEGHSERVTGLAFSNTLNFLVSGDVNAKIVVWNINGWEKQRDGSLQVHRQKKSKIPSETQIQFHPDQINFLIVHNIYLAIYEATDLRCVRQWVPKVSMVIHQATFSSDGQTVYASLNDGTLAIFDALTFQMNCRIHPSAYLDVSNSFYLYYPIAIAAHPRKPTQFAAGLTDGRVCVFEPPVSSGNWGRFLVI